MKGKREICCVFLKFLTKRKAKRGFYTYYIFRNENGGDFMHRRLIIDGNAVYELDEDCMLQKRLDQGNDSKEGERERKEKLAEKKE